MAPSIITATRGIGPFVSGNSMPDDDLLLRGERARDAFGTRILTYRTLAPSMQR